VMLRNIWEKDGSICLGFEVEGGWQVGVSSTRATRVSSDDYSSSWSPRPHLSTFLIDLMSFSTLVCCGLCILCWMLHWQLLLCILCIWIHFVCLAWIIILCIHLDADEQFLHFYLIIYLDYLLKLRFWLATCMVTL
jgi:hypothetical protein